MTGIQKRRRAKAGCLILGGAFFPLVSWAQVEEIVVTSQKRESGIQDTPIAISAFDHEALERANIENALDIQLSVPNVIFSKDNFTGSNFAIRGVGNSAVGVSADNGTGVHVNGVYLNSPRIFETLYYDVERVEVLRGPQGTLYGRNTTAGVINTITAKPGTELAGEVSLDAGNYDSLKIEGMLNLPIGDSVAQRFAFFSLDRNGYVENLYTGNEVDDRDMWSVRSTTRIAFSESAEATITAMHFEEDDSRSRMTKQQCLKDPAGVLGCLPTGLGFEVWNGAAGLPGALAGAIGLTAPGVDQYAQSINPPDMRTVYADFDPEYRVEETLLSVELNWRSAEYTVTSLTGYSSGYVESLTDYDWTVPSVDFNFPVMDFPIDGERRVTVLRAQPVDNSNDDNEQFSQEFRITSELEGPFNYTAGLFAMDFQTESQYKLHFPVGLQYGRVIGIPEAQSLFDNHTKNYEVKTWALFGEGYFSVRDAVRLTLGLRYTDERKEIDSRQVFLDFKSSITDPYMHQENDWQEWTGKIGIDADVPLDFSDETLVFANLSRGYKGGGFNPPGTVSLSNTFDPEYLNAIEVGTKNILYNDQVHANFTVFYYHYKGLQMSKIVEQTSVNENVDATIRGVEGEFVYVPDERWRVGLNLAYLKAKINDFVSFDTTDPAQTGSAEGVFTSFGSNFLIADPTSPGVNIDLKGNRLPNAPKLSANMNLAYTFFLEGSHRLTTRLQYYWQDEFYARVFNTNKDRIEAWDVWDIQLRWENPVLPWSLQAWIKNIKDDDHVTGHYTTDATTGLFTNVFALEPRTYGVTFNYRF